jgi:hypothetical protein
VLPLGALDPQDIVEQQIVVVGRSQALGLRSGR